TTTSTTNYHFNYQLPTTNNYFNYQLPTITSTTNYNRTHLLPLLQPIGTTVFTIKTTATSVTNFSTPEEARHVVRCKD
ncbi:hypothetical protein, partial [Paraburkholderia sp.]|uniref:hypothetical protein n=1 Tax=Paraburkholderia sp. TaxID=1926495 RepID=UPI002AFF9153